MMLPNTMRPKHIVVIAGTQRQYIDYCRENGLHPANDAIFAFSEITLKGLHGNKIVRTGEWWKNPVAHSHMVKDRDEVL